MKAPASEAARVETRRSIPRLEMLIDRNRNFVNGLLYPAAIALCAFIGAICLGNAALIPAIDSAVSSLANLPKGERPDDINALADQMASQAHGTVESLLSWAVIPLMIDVAIAFILARQRRKLEDCLVTERDRALGSGSD